jgi:hypothetical protein
MMTGGLEKLGVDFVAAVSCHYSTGDLTDPGTDGMPPMSALEAGPSLSDP